MNLSYMHLHKQNTTYGACSGAYIYSTRYMWGCARAGRTAGAHRPVDGILAALVGVLCSIRYVNFGERLFYVLRE